MSFTIKVQDFDFLSPRSKENFYFRWGQAFCLQRQHVLTCDIIVHLFPWPPRGQPTFTTQCDCQHSFPGLTRGAPHNQRRRHWAMSLGTAGWASMADPTLCTSAPGCLAAAPWPLRTPGPESAKRVLSRLLPRWLDPFVPQQSYRGELFRCTFTSRTECDICNVKSAHLCGFIQIKHSLGGEEWAWNVLSWGPGRNA